MSGPVTSRLDLHVGEIIFDNPPHNHLTVDILRAIADALETFDANPDCRTVILASEGSAFCAGAEFTAGDGGGVQGRGADPLREFYDQALRMFATKKPIVAAIQGAAVGAGLGLAAAADFRMASPNARFVANFTKLGFHPGFGLTCTLPRLIGAQHAARMLLTAERYKPEAVLGWGLVDAIVAQDRLREDTRSFANTIAANAPLALLATRQTLRAGLLQAVIAALVNEHAEQMVLRATADHAEGIRSVAERRIGQFTGC